jgi:NADH dehydrogenase FAD-containing subunit
LLLSCRRPAELRSALLPRGVEFITREVEEIKPEQKAIKLADGTELEYDLLLIATGKSYLP